MKRKFRRPKTWLHPRLIGRRVLQSWPLLIWLGAIGVFLILHSRSAELVGMTGVVEAVEEPIAPVETARLVALDVALGQAVKAGDTIARMDTSALDDELDVARATAAEDAQTFGAFQQSMLQLVSRADDLVRGAEIRLEEEKQNQMRDEAELRELKKELERREELLRKRLISEQDVGDLRPRIAALEQVVAAYPRLLKMHEDGLARARAEQADVTRWIQTDTDQNVSAAIARKATMRAEIFKATVARLEHRRTAYTLRATRDGIVSRINHPVGGIVQAGDPVAALVAQRPNRVIGFLPEDYAEHVELGEKALVWRQSGVGARIPAVVESVSPDVRGLPGRVSPLGGLPLRGRRIVLKLQAENDFLPGETVRIRDVGGDPLLSWIRDLFIKRLAHDEKPPLQTAPAPPRG